MDPIHLVPLANILQWIQHCNFFLSHWPNYFFAQPLATCQGTTHVIHLSPRKFDQTTEVSGVPFTRVWFTSQELWELRIGLNIHPFCVKAAAKLISSTFSLFPAKSNPAPSISCWSLQILMFNFCFVISSNEKKVNWQAVSSIAAVVSCLIVPDQKDNLVSSLDDLV